MLKVNNPTVYKCICSVVRKNKYFTIFKTFLLRFNFKLQWETYANVEKKKTSFSFVGTVVVSI